MPIGDHAGFSLVSHVLGYLIMLAAPFPVMRAPFFISPSAYAGFIAWTLFAANPLMLVRAYSFDDRPKTDSQTAAMALGVTTATCVIGAACALASMEQRWHSTFYEHRTLKKHVREFWWKQATVGADNDGNFVYKKEDIIACHAMSFARCYWPTDLVESFVRANW